MTTLKVTLNDQVLIAAERVKIASGDINSVALAVEIDDLWDVFPNRTASFYTSHNSTPHEVLLIDNQCIIPPEVLSLPGILYVGIIGVSADGESAKTSSIASFKIIPGAAHSYTTVKPELDLYQQYLKAMMEAVAPAQEVLLARLEERITEHEVEISEEYSRFKGALVEMIRPVTVWENTETTDMKWYDSSTNTVSVDLKNYSSFLVVFYESGYYAVDGYHVNSTLVGSPMIVEKGVQYEMKTHDGHGGKKSRRNFTLTDEGVVFGYCEYGDTYQNKGGFWFIPAKIIGFGC